MTVISLETVSREACNPAPVLPRRMGQGNDGNQVACIPPKPHKRHLYLHVKDTTGISSELHPALTRWPKDLRLARTCVGCDLCQFSFCVEPKTYPRACRQSGSEEG